METSKSSLNYMHDNAENMGAFLSKVRSLARDKDKAVFKVFEYANKETAHGLEDDPYKDANADLYDILNRNIALQSLTNTISQRYEDDGVKVIKYIKSGFTAGGNDNKETPIHTRCRPRWCYRPIRANTSTLALHQDTRPTRTVTKSYGSSRARCTA